jgi:hypothetical protein
MQFHHDPAHARPTADWISRYAADLLDTTPSMHPLDAVRQAMEASSTEAAEEEERKRPSWTGVVHGGTSRRS